MSDSVHTFTKFHYDSKIRSQVIAFTRYFSTFTLTRDL